MPPPLPLKQPKNTHTKTDTWHRKTKAWTHVQNWYACIQYIPIQFWYDLAHSLGRSSGRRNDVLVRTTTTTPVLTKKPKDTPLGCPYIILFFLEENHADLA